jgi:type IV pilus assembly protein PilC
MRRFFPPEAGAILFRFLAAAARNGLPLKDVVDVLARDPDLLKGDTPAAKFISDALAERGSLQEALRRLPGMFSEQTAELVGMAERAGKLAPVLDALSKDYLLRSRHRPALRGVLAWPATLGMVFAVIAMVVMIFVVPTFSELFSSFGADLPGLTLGLFAVSDVFARYWWLLIVLAVALVYAYRKEIVPEPVDHALQGIVLSVGYYRRYLERVFVSRVANWLLACHEDRELLLASLRHVAADTVQRRFSASLVRLQERIASGQGLGASLNALSPFPTRFGLLVEVAERTGDRSSGLAQAAEMSEADAADALESFSRGMELSMYLALGILIGLVIIAIYLPIFRLGTVV